MSPIQQMLLGVGAVAERTYIDDVFSTYLWAGSGSARSINNGVDMTEGGMTWIKKRSGTDRNVVTDTVRGVTKQIFTERTDGESTDSDNITSFNNNGFSLDTDNRINQSGSTYSSWTFRKAPGFFDVVTWTGDGSSSRQISHSLSSIPGLILVKRTSTSEDWAVYHRSIGVSEGLTLNSNAAQSTRSWWDDTYPTASVFTVDNSSRTNTNNETYVAYLFAGGESTAATARSVEFDGTGDGLYTGGDSGFVLGTGDLTVEGWFKWDDNSGTHHLCDQKDSSQGYHISLYTWNNTLYFHANADNRIESSIKIDRGQWYHVALTRSSGVWRLFVNGTKTGVNYTDSNNYAANFIAIGYSKLNTTMEFEGSISNFRVTKGQALYTSSFKPSTTPLTQTSQGATSSNVKLLCCNNSSVTGSTVTTGTLTSTGDPTASTDSPFDDPAAHVFGESGSESVIKCGSYVGNASTNGPEIFLGWEPQYVLVKNASSNDSWRIFDNMRGIVTGGDDALIHPNSNGAEYSGNTNEMDLTSTGFKIVMNDSGVNGNGYTYTYTAIRRPDGYVGKPPELGTGVFAMDTGNGSSTIPVFDSGFPVDMALYKYQVTGSASWVQTSRLQGIKRLIINNTSAEGSFNDFTWDSNVGWCKESTAGSGYYSWMWKRHKGFDIQRYTGKTGQQSRVHGLNAVPEMIWAKSTNNAYEWAIGHKDLTGGWTSKHLRFTDSAEITGQQYALAPTSTHWTTPNGALVNDNGEEYIAMLFASVDGISKVGSYDGSDSALTITTGFQPRFVIIRRVGTAGGPWFVLDTTRGWASGADQALKLDDDSAQSNSLDFGAPTSTGFTLSAGSSTNQDFNKSGYEYIYYAHA